MLKKLGNTACVKKPASSQRSAGAFHVKHHDVLRGMLSYCDDGAAVLSPHTRNRSNAKHMASSMPTNDTSHYKHKVYCRNIVCADSVASGCYSLKAETSCEMLALASPKSMRVLSLKKSGFSTPEKPARMERLSTNTVRALSTLMMGMP